MKSLRIKEITCSPIKVQTYRTEFHWRDEVPEDIVRKHNPENTDHKYAYLGEFVDLEDKIVIKYKTLIILEESPFVYNEILVDSLKNIWFVREHGIESILLEELLSSTIELESTGAIEYHET